MKAQPKIGTITIAPEVLETIARLTALAVPGVARMVPRPGVRRWMGHAGTEIEVIGNKVRVRQNIVTEPHGNMLHIGRQVQAEVTRAIRDMVGMEVESVDVYVDDVVYHSEDT